MTITAVRSEKVYEKYAWVIFVVLPIFGFIGEAVPGLLIGVPPDELVLRSLTGMSWSQLQTSTPQVASYIGVISVIRYYIELSLAILIIAIASTSFRKGDKWAWYAFWVLPLQATLLPVTLQLRFGGEAAAPVAGFTIPLLSIIVAGMLLPYRKFFPRRQP